MKTFMLAFMLILITSPLWGNLKFQQDTIKTDMGDLIITFIGHGSLYFSFNDLIIHIDPVSREADYSSLPKADLIFVTHQHGDHLDPEAIRQIQKENTEIVFTKECAEMFKGKGLIVKNGDSLSIKGIPVEVVPAYNQEHKRDNGIPFHPKGMGNGYVFNFGNIRVYVAGDTENIPEMADLKNIDIAFLPMNLPYTMTPEMVRDAVSKFRPKILYPYHYGNTNLDDLTRLMEDQDYCELRLRKM